MSVLCIQSFLSSGLFLPTNLVLVIDTFESCWEIELYSSIHDLNVGGT